MAIPLPMREYIPKIDVLDIHKIHVQKLPLKVINWSMALTSSFGLGKVDDRGESEGAGWVTTAKKQLKVFGCSHI